MVLLSTILRFIKLQFLIGYRTLSLKFQKARTKTEVVLSLPSWIHLLWRPGPLTTGTLTPEFGPLTPHQIPDAPIFDSSWTLTPAFWRLYGLWLPYSTNVAFDAPIPPGGIWRPNTPGWHLTPQYPQVAFDAPIPPDGIWRPNNLKWHLTPGTIFQIFQNFLDPISWIPI